MLQLWGLIGSLVVGTQVFASAPLQLVHFPGEILISMHRACASQVSVPRPASLHKRTSGSRPGRIPPNVLSSLTAKPDQTIRWEGPRSAAPDEPTKWCLEASGTSNGDVVRVKSCTGEQKQRWNLLTWGHNGDLQIQLQHSNKCLKCFDVVDSAGGFNGVPFGLWDCEEKLIEPWKFEKPKSRLTQDPTQYFGSSSIRDVVFSVVQLALPGVVALAAWLWCWQHNARATAASQIDLSWSADQGGICLTVPSNATPAVMTLSTSVDDLVVKCAREDRIIGWTQSHANNHVRVHGSLFPLECHGPSNRLLSRCAEVLMQTSDSMENLSRRCMLTGLAVVAFVLPPGVASEAAPVRGRITQEEKTLELKRVSAPLTFIGPYACVTLALPDWKDSDGNIITLPFVLDTGAESNTVDTDIAKALNLQPLRLTPAVGSTLAKAEQSLTVHFSPGKLGGEMMDDGTVTAVFQGQAQEQGVKAGMRMTRIGGQQFSKELLFAKISGTENYEVELIDVIDEGDQPVMLGDFFLDGFESTQGRYLFRTGAVPRPVAAPVGAGILGLGFMNAFAGGVELDWGDSETGPSVTLHSDRAAMEEEISRTSSPYRIPVDKYEGTNLPSVTITVNGADVPALLDTGSPITILNKPSASLAGLEPIDLDEKVSKPNWWRSLLDFISRGSQTPKEDSAKKRYDDAVARGDLVNIAGTQGGRLELLRSTEVASITMGCARFRDAKVYIGDLDVWFAANLPGLGDSVKYSYTAVLGMDVLRGRQRLIYRADEIIL